MKAVKLDNAVQRMKEAFLLCAAADQEGFFGIYPSERYTIGKAKAQNVVQWRNTHSDMTGVVGYFSDLELEAVLAILVDEMQLLRAQTKRRVA